MGCHFGWQSTDYVCASIFHHHTDSMNEPQPQWVSTKWRRNPYWILWQLKAKSICIEFMSECVNIHTLTHTVIQPSHFIISNRNDGSRIRRRDSKGYHRHASFVELQWKFFTYAITMKQKKKEKRKTTRRRWTTTKKMKENNTPECSIVFLCVYQTCLTYWMPSSSCYKFNFLFMSSCMHALILRLLARLLVAKCEMHKLANVLLDFHAIFFVVVGCMLRVARISFHRLSSLIPFFLLLRHHLPFIHSASSSSWSFFLHFCKVIIFM